MDRNTVSKYRLISNVYVIVSCLCVVVLAGFKIVGHFNISWMLVLSPWLVPLALAGITFGVMFAYVFVTGKKISLTD